MMDKSLTLQAWVHALEQNFAAKFDTTVLPHSVLSMLSRVFGGASFELYKYLDVLTEQVMIDTATGEYLSRWAGIWGIYRQAAQFAQGDVLVQTETSVSINKGAQLRRSDGVLFQVTKTIPIVGTQALPIKAIEPGNHANTSSDVNLQWVSPIAGVARDTIIISPGITGGGARESDDSLRGRLLARLQNPILGGRAQDYIQWAKEIPGVKTAWVSPCYFGVGTVAVTYLYAGDDAIPSPAHIQQVQNHLSAQCPVAAKVFVLAPEVIAVNISLTITPDEAIIRERIITELTNTFAQQTYPGMALNISFYHRVLSTIQGLTDYQLILPNTSQTFQFQQIPRLGHTTWQTH